MQKLVKIVLVLLVITTSCKSVKKVQIIETQIFKKDTAQNIVISEAQKGDSAAIIRNIMSKLVKRKIEYASFNAKINVDYETADNSQKMTAYVSLKKDSALFIKIAVSPYGVLENIYVNKDSVILIRTKGEKSIQYSAISYLQETTNIPFDFSTLQDILVGNPIFLDSNIVSYKSSSTQLLVYLVGSLFKNFITLDNVDFRVLHSKLDDLDDKRNRTCDITLSNYLPLNGFQFATYRTISVSEKSKLDISLDFKQYDFNNPLQYRFAIPVNYKPKKTVTNKTVTKKTTSKK